MARAVNPQGGGRAGWTSPFQSRRGGSVLDEHNSIRQNEISHNCMSIGQTRFAPLPEAEILFRGKRKYSH
ncbi:hypothetical protein V1478_014013 [Vespula squamosa]|uniref:Uncharacterized protein n=1 Tax=Vespula squamosa TaxID=30214 RepID=A0ABD2A737_VESSQ